MTPDRNGTNTGAQRQSTSTHSMEWADASDPFDELPRQTNALEDDVLASPSGDSLDAISEASVDSDEEGPSFSTSSFSRAELFRQVGLQVSPILIPLLLGGLTFLVTLPFVLNGHSYVSFNRFWPIGLVIIALAILQGMGLYYAGSSTVYWMMCVVGGFFLFMLVACFSIFGPLPAIILLLALLALGLFTMYTLRHIIKEGTVAIVTASGKYSRTLLPGLNFLLPWERIETTVRTKEVQWPCPEQKVRISRDEDVLLHATISYQLEPEDAHIAALQVEQWEDSLRRLFCSALQTVAGELTPEDFLVWSKGFRSRQPVQFQQSGGQPRWERINGILYQRMLDKVALWGVQINWIQVYDIMLVPHVATEADIAAGTANDAVPPQATKQAGTGYPPSAPSQKSTAAKELKSMNAAQLMSAYNSVKKGAITDPATIRTIAARFDAIAKDPEQSQKVEFDAERAARNLYLQAQKLADQMSFAEFSDITQPDFNDIKQPDWNMRRPTDD